MEEKLARPGLPVGVPSSAYTRSINGIPGRGPSDHRPSGHPFADESEGPRLGLSGRQQLVSSLVSQLAITARSFALYDLYNETVRHALEGLLESLDAALREIGDIQLAVRPDAIHFDGTAVYVNRDHERSLAFRLYRDGVRALRIRPGFGAEELTRLLEVLSVRFTGVHQDEDDVVTLLWRARFSHLEVTAVDGVIQDDGRPADRNDPSIERDVWQNDAFLRARLQDEIDMSRLLLPSGALGWKPVAPDTREAMRREVSEHTLPVDCVMALEQIRTFLDDAIDPVPFRELAHLFREVRDYLLAWDHLEVLLRYLSLLKNMIAQGAPNWDRDRPAEIREVFYGCGSRASVVRLLRSIPPDQRHPSPELIQVLDMTCEEPLDALVDALASEEALGTRAVARQLLERYADGHPERILERFPHNGGHVGADLVRVAARLGRESLVGFLLQQCGSPDQKVQGEALEQLERMPHTALTARTLIDVLARVSRPQRPRALTLITRTRDRRLEEPLVRFVEERAAQLNIDEATELGRALGALAGEAGVGRWQGWLTPRGLFKKALPGTLAEQVVAATALSVIPGERSAQALRAALVVASEDARDRIGHALAHQRALSRRSGELN